MTTRSLYLINSLEGGGAERVFSTLISLIDERKTNEDLIEVVLLDDVPDVYSLPYGIKVHRLSNRTIKSLFSFLFFFLAHTL